LYFTELHGFFYDEKIHEENIINVIACEIADITLNYQPLTTHGDTL